MRLKFEAPKEKPKVSLDIELDEADQAKVKLGMLKLLSFVKSKLPVGMKVESGQEQNQR